MANVERKVSSNNNGYRQLNAEVFKVLRSHYRLSDHVANLSECMIAVNLPNGNTEYPMGEGETPEAAFHRAFRDAVVVYDKSLAEMKLWESKSHVNPDGKKPKAVLVFKFGDQQIKSTAKANTRDEAFHKAVVKAYNKALHKKKKNNDN